ncbi:MAG TPA: MBL fold metallo-hydrolase [Terriglobia bacterium]|nr:MBL fold metallo-hydrolase [Terriglobia bacterium]
MMKRGLVLGTLIALGGLSLVVSGFQAPPAGPSAAARAATKIEKVKDNLYVITGSGVADTNAFSGGNTAVLVTDAGVVIVDTKLPGWGQIVLDRIKTVTNKPVTTIINTHTHGDHTGSNEFFGATVDSIVHENTKANMAKMNEFKGDKARFLPKRTYKDKMTLGTGKDQIDLYYFGRGHTNGDTFVVFPALRTMHAGDMFAWKALPYIDTDNGGSVVAHPQTLAKVIATVKNVDTVIAGHIPTSTWNDLKEYADFSQDFVTWAQTEMKAGKTVDQAAPEYKLPAKYRGYVASANPQFGGVKPNLQALYNELKK